MTTIACGALGLLAVASAAVADDGETLAMRRVRLTTEPASVRGCTRVAAVRDDSVKDLRRKIVRAGGNTALLTFAVEDMEYIYADVFRCAPVLPLPPDVPPPPPGLPPPPPPNVAPSPAPGDVTPSPTPGPTR